MKCFSIEGENNMNNTNILLTQKTSLKLLKIFANICQKYNLRYYIGGGTMLGAVRHKGFIPWDDDVDIDMPREDYKKFLNIYKKELKEHPECDVYSFYTNNSIFPVARLVDKSIKVKKTEGIISDYITPIWLDIVPVDGLPDNVILRKLHLLKLSIIKEFYHMSVIKYGGVTTNENKREKRPWYKKLAVWAGINFPLEKIFKYNTWIRIYDKELSKYSFYESKLVGTLMSQHGKKSIFPAEWYGKGTKYQFEDIEVIGVDNYDAWLTQLYGDYMKIPDEKNRVNHNIEIID